MASLQTIPDVNLVALPREDPQHSFRQLIDGLREDMAMQEEVKTIETQECSQMLVFHLVHLQPNSRTRMGLLSKMRQDHAIVALYDVHFLGFKNKQLSFMSQIEGGTVDMANIRLLGLDAFWKAGWGTIVKHLIECPVSSKVQFPFVDTMPLEDAQGPVHFEVCAALMAAEAYPCPSGTFQWIEGKSSEVFGQMFERAYASWIGN